MRLNAIDELISSELSYYKNVFKEGGIKALINEI